MSQLASKNKEKPREREEATNQCIGQQVFKKEKPEKPREREEATNQ